MLLIVNDQQPYKTVKDFVDDARTRPNEIVFSSSGLYGALHLLAAQFMRAAGTQLKAGKVRAPACFSPNRAASLPDVPTLKELGYDVEFSLWAGLFAPRGTQDAVIDKLRDETKKAFATEQFAKAIENIGDVVAYLDLPDFAKLWTRPMLRTQAASSASRDAR